MNKLQIFKNNDFGEIRTAVIKSEPYFMLNDVCKILELNNVSQVKSRLKEDGVITNEVIDSLSRKQQATFINESNLYKVIFQSRKPEAEQFTEWITAEVLPTIRRHGAYMTPETLQKSLTNPDFIIQLATQLKEEQQKRLEAENKMTEQRPKVLFAEAVEVSKNSILVGELAKILKQNGIEIGQNRLFTWLRNNGYLCKVGENYNLPTQYAMELSLFEIKKTTINNPDGSVRVTRTTKVTGKGQIYFVNKFKATA